MAGRSLLKEDNKENLYLVASLVQRGGQALCGYRRELVTQQMSEIELQLLVCYVCFGFMRNACNTIDGTAMGCEVCVGTAAGAQAVGTVRAMVSNLKCKCPLMERGCTWDGSIGEVAQHLDICSSLVVICGYSVYGCPEKLRRGDLDVHRKEGIEYHTELMSSFLTQKIDQLEGYNRVQGQAIRDLQDSMQVLRAERKYMRPNGALWRISGRSIIKAKMEGFNAGYQQNMGMAYQQNMGMGYYQGNLANPEPQWSGNTCFGPNFEIDSILLRAQLTIESADKVALQIVDSQPSPQVSQYSNYHVPGGRDKNVAKSEVKWPLRGKCKVLLINPTNRNADWIKEVNTSRFQNTQPITLLNIPSHVLLDDKYNDNDTVEIQVLFKTSYSI